MTPLEAIRLWGLEKLGRYYSKYRAIVLDSNPDNDNTGNIIVKIPRVQGGMIIKARSGSFYGGIGFGYKGFTPKPGELVWVEFENGNPTKPIWSYHTWGKLECPKDLRDINSCGIVTPNGNKIIIKESESKNTLEIIINNSSILLEDDQITINGGTNKGLVNIEPLRGFIQAVAKDLLIAQSGSNVSKWMSSDLSKLEDKKVNH